MSYYVESDYIDDDYFDSNCETPTYVEDDYVENGYVGVSSAIVYVNNDKAKVKIYSWKHKVRAIDNTGKTLPVFFYKVPLVYIHSLSPLIETNSAIVGISATSLKINAKRAYVINEINIDTNVKISLFPFRINIFPNYVKNLRKNVFCYPTVERISISLYDVPISVKISTSALSLKIINKGSSVNSSPKKKIKRINNVTLNNSLDWSEDTSIKDFMAQRSLAIDGSSVISVKPFGYFSKSVILKGKFIKNTIINDIISLISENTVELVFTDSEIKIVKFDLTDVPISVFPIYSGAEYSNIIIRVLL